MRRGRVSNISTSMLVSARVSESSECESQVNLKKFFVTSRIQISISCSGCICAVFSVFLRAAVAILPLWSIWLVSFNLYINCFQITKNHLVCFYLILNHQFTNYKVFLILFWYVVLSTQILDDLKKLKIRSLKHIWFTQNSMNIWKCYGMRNYLDNMINTTKHCHMKREWRKEQWVMRTHFTTTWPSCGRSFVRNSKPN